MANPADEPTDRDALQAFIAKKVLDNPWAPKQALDTLGHLVPLTPPP